MARLLVIMWLALLAGAPVFGGNHLGCAPTLADPLGLLGDCAAAPPVQAPSTPYRIVDRRGDIGPDGFSFALREDHIFFLGGGANITPAEAERITRLAQILQTNPLRETCLRLVGHADTSGPEAANKATSLRRAQAVSDLLGPALGEPSRIIELAGMGEEEPLASFAPTAAEQRRVAIYVRRCDLP